ncbi:MAG: ketopantoate reductase C-terminal domain-containing protein [Methyloligellaceae bacterium]
MQASRPTEVDHLQGEIVGLAEKLKGPAPLNRLVLDLVKQAEKAQKGTPALTPEVVEAGA